MTKFSFEKRSVCILCQSRSSDDGERRSFLFDSDDEDENESRCQACGVDKIFAASAKEAHMINGVIAQHKEPPGVDSLFDRITLKEHYTPESKVFTLNKANLAEFLRSARENNASPSAESCDSENNASLDDSLSCGDSDLQGCFSQQSLAFLDRQIYKKDPPTPKQHHKRTISTGSAGFSPTPKRLKRKTARCLWNPFFMQHTLVGASERNLNGGQITELDP